MSSAIIEVRDLSKRYRLGQIGVRSLGEEVERLFSPMGNQRSGTETSRDFWALKEVSFDVQPGEVLGIIGRNGAGKSTLLKILSRITEPTSGEAILRGRVASLLEVGTGFHPELTGRENVYLNGAILGMKKREIDARFEEIVAFAEMERHIDTPVKRYSSGQSVRLGFAVAAHLEAEILIVDEVLAVGDAAFQRKCLASIRRLATGSDHRTVLFVSHNAAAVQVLCDRVAYLDRGSLQSIGPTRSILERYYAPSAGEHRADLRERPDREGDGSVRLTGVEILGEFPIRTGGPFRVAIDYTPVTRAATAVGLSLWTSLDERVISLSTAFTGPLEIPGGGRAVCEIPSLPLVDGFYWLNVAVESERGLADYVTHTLSFQVERGDVYGTGKSVDPFWGRIAVPCVWSWAEA